MIENSRRKGRFSTRLFLQHNEIITKNVKIKLSASRSSRQFDCHKTEVSCMPPMDPTFRFFNEARSDQSANIFFLDNWFSLFFIDFQLNIFCYLLFAFFFTINLACESLPGESSRGQHAAAYPICSFKPRGSRGLETKGVCRPSKS